MSQETKPFRNQKRISPLFHIQRTTGAEFSEIRGWTLPVHYGSPEREKQALKTGAVVLDLSPRGKVFLRGERLDPFLNPMTGQNPDQIGQVIKMHPSDLDEISHISLARLTQDEVLLLTPPGEESSLIRYLQKRNNSSPRPSWVDQTAGYAGFLLAGPRARDIMRKRTSLPLDEGSFPDLRVVQTRFARIRALILHHDLAGTPGFEIYTDRSLGEYVWETILDAGSTWDLQPAGWQLYTSLTS